MPHKQRTSDVGSWHFSENKELYEIQRGNNFEFIIDKNLDGINAYGSDVKTFPNAREYIRLSVSSAFIPHYRQQAIEVRRGNTAVKYAGTMSWDNGQIQCYDFIGAEVKDILMAWQAQAGNPKYQTVGQQADYKRDATLVEYPPDYSGVVRTWRLQGCWISSISEEPMNQNNGNNARNISCTIEYDRAYVDYE